VDPDYYPFLVMAIVGFTVGTVAFVGEWLGWWHVFGEVVGFVSFTTGVLGIILPFAIGPSKRELRDMRQEMRDGFAGIHDGFAGIHDGFAGIHEGFAGMRHGIAAMVAGQGSLVNELRLHTELLREIRDA